MKAIAPITQEFTINYSYQLHFTKGLFTVDNPIFNTIVKSYSPNKSVKLFFAVDSGVAIAHPNLTQNIIDYCENNVALDLTEIILIKGGEAAKNDTTQVEKVLKGINNNAICRHSFVLVIGGGAVIDMVGYAANIAHRGVKLIRIPTTVLAQNDAAVGVKNGVNAFDKKNFLGTFTTPFAIINDFNFLKTLAQRDWVSGISEAVKVALIKDAEFYGFIKNNAKKLASRDMEPMQHLIYRCAELHMQHISQGGDPFESGSSRPLDFGHWAAHKLEYMTNYTIRHGEAVAMGIALDLTYAHLIGLINENILNDVLQVLKTSGFNLQLPLKTEAEMDTLVEGVEEFREHLGGELTITLISEVGEKHDVHQIDFKLMKEAILLRSKTIEQVSC